MKRAKGILCSGVALILMISACTLAPPLKTPVVPSADAYKEIGPWTQAQPADRLPRDSWWALYGNTELDDLEKRLIAGNPTLAAAFANYAQARALADQARAGLFPTLGLNASAQRNRESANAPLRGPTTPTYFNSNTLGGSVSYELDLWGQIRNEVAAGEANAAASAADLENARLSLIAQLVQDYIQLRSLDRDSAILDETVKAYARALGLTEQRHDAGIAPGLDVAQAQTQLNAALSQAAQTLAQRALMEHAIAALLGVSVSTFSINPEIVAIHLPQIPSGVPSTLLERRPDIAGAQRRMIAANANIGVARAAYFPTLTLGGQGGFQSTAASNWLSAPSVSEGKYAARATPMLALAAIMRRWAAAISGRRCSNVVGTPLGICGSVMATIFGSIENVDAETPSSAAIACSIRARWASVCADWERAASSWVCACETSRPGAMPASWRCCVRLSARV